MRKNRWKTKLSLPGAVRLCVAVAALAPAIGAMAAPAFHETFEDDAQMAGIPGPLDGQNGWSVSGTTTVQSAESWEFDQAVRLGTTEISRTVSASPTNAQVVFSWKPSYGSPGAIPPNSTAVCWVNENGLLSAYSNSTSVISSTSVSSSQWSRVVIHCDYSAKVWSLWLDGTLVFKDLAFYSPVLSQLSGVRFHNGAGAGYLDDIQVGAAQASPQPGDSDADGLPDDWELAFFLSPNVSDGSGDFDGDRLSDGGENIAGTDPTDPASVFAVLDASILDGTNMVVQWPSVAGRLYDIEECDDLVAGMWSNVVRDVLATPPLNTTTVRVGQATSGFMQLKGRLQP